MNRIKNHFFGILVSVLIATAAWFAGNAFPLVGGAVFGILAGIVAGSLLPRDISSGPGVTFASKKVLQWAIIILGSGLSLRQVYATGAASLVIIIVTISAAFLIVLAAGRFLKVNFNLTSLIGVGTAICGGSAIAAISPIIDAEDQEIAYAISTVFLFNVVAVFGFPPIGHALGLSQQGFGLFAGTAINDTSSVVAAGYTYGNTAGDYATIVKLTRTIMIVPIALVFVALMMYRRKRDVQLASAPHFSPSKIFPWFILGFLLMSALNTCGAFGAQGIEVLKQTGKFMIVMALSAIGLKTDFRKMLATGPKPMIMGLVVWVGVASASLILQLASGQW